MDDIFIFAGGVLVGCFVAIFFITFLEVINCIFDFPPNKRQLRYYLSDKYYLREIKKSLRKCEDKIPQQYCDTVKEIFSWIYWTDEEEE